MTRICRKFVTQGLWFTNSLEAFPGIWRCEEAPCSYQFGLFDCPCRSYLHPSEHCDTARSRVWASGYHADLLQSLDSSVSIVTATGWTTAVLFWAGVGILFFLSSPPRQDRLWGPPSFLSNGCWGFFLRGVKRPGCEADHSLRSSDGVKNAWSYTTIPPCVFIVWFLVKLRIRFHGVMLS
jgi:hypothetical protein